MCSATADKDRKRCIIIEGPARQGKSWLLSMIDHRARTDPALGLRTCLISSELFRTVDFDPLKLIHLVWRSLHDLIPEELCPAALYGVPPNELDDELLATHVTLDLQPAPLHRLITTLKQQSQPIYFGLLVDGMDEVQEGGLAKLELEFISELFTLPQVRLLSARRSDSPAHIWRLSVIRKQRNGFLNQEAPRVREGIWLLDALDPDAASQQLEERRVAAGVALSADELRARIDTYDWCSPGVNAALIKAIAHEQASVSAAAVEHCLRELMFTHLTGSISDQNFERLKLIVGYYNQQVRSGLSDMAISKLLDMLAMRDHLRQELEQARAAQPAQPVLADELARKLARVEQALADPDWHEPQARAEPGGAGDVVPASLFDPASFKAYTSFESDLVRRGVARKGTVLLEFSPTIVQLFEALLKLERQQ